MRRHELTIAAVLVAAGGAVAACGSKSGGDAELGRGYPSPPTKAAPDEALATAHQEFLDTVAKRIDEVGKKMEELNAKIAAAAEDQKPALQKLSDDLARKNDAVAADLKALRDAAAEKWNEMRDQLEAAVTDIEKAATDALMEHAAYRSRGGSGNTSRNSALGRSYVDVARAASSRT